MSWWHGETRERLEAILERGGDHMPEDQYRAIKGCVAFMAQHEITNTELDDPHWQTLLAIQYPEARP